VPFDSGVEHKALAKDAGDRLAGSVVAGRPQTAGDQHDIRTGPALAELRGNILGIIRYRDVPAQFDSAGPELRAYERQVPIGGQPKEELVAKGEEFAAKPVGSIFQTICWVS